MPKLTFKKTDHGIRVTNGIGVKVGVITFTNAFCADRPLTVDVMRQIIKKMEGRK